MSTVLIPAWRRPEMLWHCLQNIRRAEGAAEHHYILLFDYGHSPELHQVAKDFPFSHEVVQQRQVKYRVAKQSYNLLNGYAIAAQKANGGLVIMVEDDVMVATDFFRYHHQVHEQQPDLFCSLAVANPNRIIQDIGEAHEYYLGNFDYCSLGVAFKSDTLTHDVLPWVKEAYYIDPIKYVSDTFKGCPLSTNYAEQDGLIRRVQWSMGPARPIAYPYQAKAYHAGFYGKNRGAGPAGPLASCIKIVGDIIYSDQAMRTFAKHPEWYEDSKPINLTAQPWPQPTLSHKLLDLQRNPIRL